MLKMKLLMVFPLLAVLTGCLGVVEEVHNFDLTTGRYEIDYKDIRSQDEDNANYLDNDWGQLKRELFKTNDYSPDKKIAIVSKTLFPDGDVLSGKAVYQVECLTCYDSKVDLLKAFHDGQWELSGDEIILKMSMHKPLKSCNGRLGEEINGDICAWPATTDRFQFVIEDAKVREGISLLQKYQEDPKKADGQLYNPDTELIVDQFEDDY